MRRTLDHLAETSDSLNHLLVKENPTLQYLCFVVSVLHEDLYFAHFYWLLQFSCICCLLLTNDFFAQLPNNISSTTSLSVTFKPNLCFVVNCFISSFLFDVTGNSYSVFSSTVQLYNLSIVVLLWELQDVSARKSLLQLHYTKRPSLIIPSFASRCGNPLYQVCILFLVWCGLMMVRYITFFSFWDALPVWIV